MKVAVNGAQILVLEVFVVFLRMKVTLIDDLEQEISSIEIMKLKI